jgi:hypothetical protein
LKVSLKIKIVCISLFFSLANLTAQTFPFSIQWQNCIGGTNGEMGRKIQLTNDGGSIICGMTQSNDGDIVGYHGGNSDVLLVKMNDAGVVLWQRSLGGSGADIGRSVKQTLDGGYIVVGETTSNNDDVSGNHGSTDGWIIKLDSFGIIQWQKCIGGTSQDYFQEINQLNDGTYFVAGRTGSNDGDVLGNNGGTDAWALKLDILGSIIWQNCFGGSGFEQFNTFKVTLQGDLILCGSTFNSNNGDVTGNNGLTDGWVVCANNMGVLLWQTCLGGSGNDYLNDLFENNDGTFYLAGSTLSNNGDVTGNHGGQDAWLFQLTSNGDVLFQKCFGGVGTDLFDCIINSADNNIILSGHTNSVDGDISNFIGGLNDAWLVKINTSGTIIWEKCLGGTAEDYLFSLVEGPNGQLLSTGYTHSNDVDVSGNNGLADCWVLKLNECNINVNAGSNQTICQGASITLSGSGAESYSWDNSLIDGQSFMPVISAEYVVIGTDVNGCIGTDTVNVQVNNSSSSSLTETALDFYTLNGQTYTQSGTYTHVIPNAADCDSTITLNLSLSFSGLDENNKGFSIFPNPAKNQINIEYAGQIHKLEIVDFKGAKVYSSTENKKVYALPTNVQTGYYMLLMFTNEGVFRKELMIDNE